MRYCFLQGFTFYLELSKAGNDWRVSYGLQWDLCHLWGSEKVILEESSVLKCYRASAADICVERCLSVHLSADVHPQKINAYYTCSLDIEILVGWDHSALLRSVLGRLVLQMCVVKGRIAWLKAISGAALITVLRGIVIVVCGDRGGVPPINIHGWGNPRGPHRRLPT